MARQQNGNFINPYGSIGQMENNPSQNTINGSGSGFQNLSMQQSNMRIHPSFLPGRVIREERDIVPNEIPMDGNIGVFVQQDLQRIYAKTWGGDGLIHTNLYELVIPNQQNGEPKEDPMTLILERLDRIEESLKRDKQRYQSDRKQKKPYRNRETNDQNVREEK